MADLNCDERLEVALLQHLPSDDEWEDETSPGRLQMASRVLFYVIPVGTGNARGGGGGKM